MQSYPCVSGSVPCTGTRDLSGRTTSSSLMPARKHRSTEANSLNQSYHLRRPNDHSREILAVLENILHFAFSTL